MGERIEARALGAFVDALERGEMVEAAAKAAGVAASTFYRRRETCPEFAQAWDSAVAKSAGFMLIAGGNKRQLQKRRTRRIRFTKERKETFLAYFAATCDQKAAAAAAGVCTSTVDKHLRSDPAFAEAWQAALETGYRALEAELVRQMREAPGAYAVIADPEAAEAARGRDFDRSLKLIESRRRKNGRIGRRDPPQGDARLRWSFDEAVVLLEKKLKAFGVRIEAEESERAKNPLHHPSPEATDGHEQVRTPPGLSQPCRGHGAPAHPRPGEDQE